MRTRDGKVATLSRSRLLRGLGHRGLEAVARVGEVVDVDEGAVLEVEGRHPARWWLVLDGLVVLDGAEGTAASGRGDWWGAADALGGGRARTTVRAFERSRCLVVDGSRLRALLLEVPDLAVELLRR